jgi:hypothetical protein
VITYFDTFALLKLVVEEAGSDRVATVWDAADAAAAAALVLVEARVALAAAARVGRLAPSQHQSAKRGVASLVDQLAIVKVSESLIAEAADLAEQQALRGYDAVHLAAALTVGATVMASADRELCQAAERRGLHVANPLDE